MITTEELGRRFNYRAPADEGIAARHAAVRRAAKATAKVIVDRTREGREQSLAITKLEEAMMWANAAIAREE